MIEISNCTSVRRNRTQLKYQSWLHTINLKNAKRFYNVDNSCNADWLCTLILSIITHSSTPLYLRLQKCYGEQVKKINY